ncbi:SAM-dependent methyltransferase [Oxalobacteraceae bacterium GrIS 1.11]
MEPSRPKDYSALNTGSHEDFYVYYEKESAGELARQRFLAIQITLLRLVGRPQVTLNVADIGCGAGTQCRLWAEAGHHLYGADINEPLIQLARKRAERSGLTMRFEVASATALPWPDRSMDLCIAPELLEHVADWQACLSEMIRVLKPGGALYLSTSNKLCPMQEEFTLPLYSWYPCIVKRRIERLACSTRPELAVYAVYPAVNWFTFYGLRDHLARQGVVCIDRFDMSDAGGHGWLAHRLLGLLRSVPALRFLGHVATPYTILFGIKGGG